MDYTVISLYAIYYILYTYTTIYYYRSFIHLYLYVCAMREGLLQARKKGGKKEDRKLTVRLMGAFLGATALLLFFLYSSLRGFYYKN